jgi:hypothetical protein
MFELQIANFRLQIIAALVLLSSAAVAQESPTPTASPTPSATPSPAHTRSVRISFLPPPLEGTISLGIYDPTGKLVRILIQEGDVDEFEVGADALVIKWDGKNDKDEDLPAGKYRAHGYLVGHMKIEDLGAAENPPADLNGADHVTVKLVPNSLSKDARLTVDLAVGVEDETIFLKTTDGLPLLTVIEAPQVARVGVTKNGGKAIDVWADGGSAIEQVRVSNIDKMMAFDCGEIELK